MERPRDAHWGTKTDLQGGRYERFCNTAPQQQQQQQLGFSPLPTKITRPRPAATGQSLGLAGARLTPTHTRDTGRVVGSYFGPRPHELSRTTLYVADLLLCGDLLRLRSEEVADTLHISPTTLRRRLRADGTNYQSILDHVRRHRCTVMLEKRWLPGKCVAWELGYAEVNSFYRAFRRWTGHNYSDLKQLFV